MNDHGIPVLSELVFGVGVSSLCTDITTTDDVVYEGNESFTLLLSGNMDISEDTATVLIVDNDGLQTHNNINNQLNILCIILQGLK